MNLIVGCIWKFEAKPEKQKFQVVVNFFGCLVFGIAAIVTFSLAFAGFAEGFPFVASMGLLIFALILTILVIAIPSITRKWI